MAGLKETRERINSVKNTKKITYAMKLVSAAKLGRAQDAAKSFSIYNESLTGLLNNTLRAMDGVATHPLTSKKESVNKIAVIVVGANRGLCGGFNANVNKALDAFIASKSENLDFYIYGKKPAEYFRSKKIEYVESYENLSDYPDAWGIENTLDKLVNEFSENKVQEVYVIYTKFKSALSMQAISNKLLPLTVEKAEEEQEVEGSKPEKFEPSAKDVYSELLPRVIRASLRRAILDSKAGEHASRMTAMDAATKNAGDLIESLTLTYNKARQNGITSEMLDIVGGAEAISS